MTQSRIDKLLFWGALSFSIWFGSALAPWIWRVVWPDESVLILAAKPPVASRSHLQGIGEVAAAQHLFGQAERQVQAPLAKAPPPKTRLNLVLYGVQVSESAAQQGAIIGAPGRPSDYYRVGDTLPGGARLAQVRADHVILDRNGVREALYFSENRDTGIQVAQARQKPQVTPEMFLKRAQSQLRRNPRQALASVGLKPSDSGQGYVYQGNNPMLNAMNMQKGDVIRSVNGYVLGNIEEDRKLLQQLYEQGNLQVEIERGGATFTINYALR